MSNHNNTSNQNYSFENDFGNDKKRIEKWENASIYIRIFERILNDTVTKVAMDRKKRSEITMQVSRGILMRSRNVFTPKSDEPLLDQIDLTFGISTPVPYHPENGRSEWRTLLENAYDDNFIDIIPISGRSDPVVVYTMFPKGLIASGIIPGEKDVHYQNRENFKFFNAMRMLRHPVPSVIMLIDGRDVYVRDDSEHLIKTFQGFPILELRNKRIIPISAAVQSELFPTKIEEPTIPVKKRSAFKVVEASPAEYKLVEFIPEGKPDVSLGTYIGNPIPHEQEEVTRDILASIRKPGAFCELPLRPSTMRSSTEYEDDEEYLFIAEAARFLDIKPTSIYGIDLIRHPYMVAEEIFIPALHRNIPMWRKKNLRRYLSERGSRSRSNSGIMRLASRLSAEDAQRLLNYAEDLGLIS